MHTILYIIFKVRPAVIFILSVVISRENDLIQWNMQINILDWGNCSLKTFLSVKSLSAIMHLILVQFGLCSLKIEAISVTVPKSSEVRME